MADGVAPGVRVVLAAAGPTWDSAADRGRNTIAAVSASAEVANAAAANGRRK